VDFDVIDQHMVIFCIDHTLHKERECNETLHLLFTDFEKAYASLREKVLYRILIEFGTTMKFMRSS
jgi:hypothetical protein